MLKGSGFTPFGDPLTLNYYKHPLGLWYKNKSSTWHLYHHTQMGFSDYVVWAANRKNKIVRHYPLLEINHIAACGIMVRDTEQFHNGWDTMLKGKCVCKKCLAVLKEELKAQGLLVKRGTYLVYLPSQPQEELSPATAEEKLLDKGEKAWYDI